MKNILLTGHPGVGKTTLLYKIIERLNLSIGGFKVDRYINQIGSTETKTFILSSLFNGIDNFKIAKVRSTDSSFDMNIFPEEFEKASIAIINRSIMERDVIVLDEIGVMESNSPLFKQSIIDSFESPKLVIGILKGRDAPFLNSIRNRDDVDIINVTCENRSSLLQTILDMLQNHFKDDNVIRNNYFSNDHNRI
ncbi:MAG: nucleoside-triphosphatase, partial [Clostridium sp.]